MNSNEEKVLFRAREMAAICYPKGYKLSEWSKVLDMARLSVQREAEIIIEWMDNYAWTLEGKQEYLISKGLIPPKTEPV